MHLVFLLQKKRGIFDGTVALIPDMNNGDKEKLWAMLVWNGGRVAESLTTPGITHIITPYVIPDNEDHCEVKPSW